jgi:hypothetical protein
VAQIGEPGDLVEHAERTSSDRDAQIDAARDAFYRGFIAEAVGDFSTAGHAPETISLDAVVKHINTSETKPGHQTVGLDLIGLTGEAPRFLVNPRHDIQLTDVDLALQQAEGEARPQSDLAELDLAPHGRDDAVAGLADRRRHPWMVRVARHRGDIEVHVEIDAEPRGLRLADEVVQRVEAGRRQPRRVVVATEHVEQQPADGIGIPAHGGPRRIDFPAQAHPARWRSRPRR